MTDRPPPATGEDYGDRQKEQPWGCSVVRWAGSKRQIVPLLLEHVPDEFDRYVEPFCGSGALFFALAPAQALLADINEELVLLLDVLKRHPRRLSTAVSEMEVTEARYYEIRDQRPEDLTDFERAARLLYLTRNSFNGIYRTNRKGHFNVPMGRRTGDHPPERIFYRCSYALRAATLVAQDFTKTLELSGPGDFVYADPPYFAERSTYGEYGYGSYRSDQQSTLVRSLKEAAARGCRVLISYRDDVEFTAEFTDWHKISLSAKTRIAGQTKYRGARPEVLIRNY